MLTRLLRVIAASLALLAGIAAVFLLWPDGRPHVQTSFAKGVLASREQDGIGYVLYVPTTIDETQPITPLIALRGVGVGAQAFAETLVADAEAYGWMLIVPNYSYGDWRLLEDLKADARKELPWMKNLLDVLPRETGLALRDRVLVYGFSRGAQTAHRFALAYPNKVLAVATMSGGTYTLPKENSTIANHPSPLTFPIGVSDLDKYCGRPFDIAALKKVSFWVGVGALDNAPGDLPRVWDPYLGTTRVDRAKAFAKAVRDLGATAEMSVIPGIGHQESAKSRSEAFGFLKGVEIGSLGGTAGQDGATDGSQ